MPIVITKFGGTSVSSKKTWDNIIQITKQHIQSGFKPVLVCSARSKASNLLEELIDKALNNQFQELLKEFHHIHFELAHELNVPQDILTEEFQHLEKWLTGIALLKHVPAKTHALIMSLGELLLTKMGHHFLESNGLHTLWYDARNAIQTEDYSPDEQINYCQARCIPQTNRGLQNELINHPADVVITQGFIAANAKKETVLLGRGGSDTSASLFAAILQANQCEIWTDVPGIYTANPHQLPQARLLKQLNYDEAQEISSMGAKVLHPMAISPVRQALIPMAIKYTWKPEHPGTLITQKSDIDAPPVKSIQIKSSISIISIDTASMWQQTGFLANIFQIFAKHHFSINLISTAECNITLSLDGQAHPRNKLQNLLDELNPFCRAKLIEPCSAISLIGHHIRRILPDLGPSFELFNDQQVHLISLASNDLSLNIVVDESKAEKMMQQLHQLLIDNNPQSFYYSKSWQEEFNLVPEAPEPWWLEQKEQLLHFAQQHAPCYVYHPQILQQKIHELKTLKSINKIFYALKANANTEILNTIYQAGLNFECVSIQEIQKVLQLFPAIDRKRILFTPNFAHQYEYQFALDEQVILTIDSLYPLQQWGNMLYKQSVLLRIDPGMGAGHPKYVSTSGDESKFGIPIQDIPHAKSLILKNEIKIVGLHAHAGSGILSPQLWPDTAKLLLSCINDFPEIRIIDLGGGLGIVERPGQLPLDLDAIETQLYAIKKKFPHIELWLEPGRMLVAECGVLLTRATQEKTKNKVRFIGVDVGMNSLLRPALYGSYHHIVNLTRHDHPIKTLAHVVGPICESSDTLGYDRLMPPTAENDIILIATTGAYGYSMSSHYNLRPPATEFIFKED